MSICYVTRQPMTLQTAIEDLEAWGCVVEPSDENDENGVTVLDPDGNCLHLTGGSHVILSANPVTGFMTTCPTGIEDETRYVRGKAYGLLDNDPTMMVEILDMAAEGEEDFEEIMSQMFPWPEEAEDEATS